MRDRLRSWVRAEPAAPLDVETWSAPAAREGDIPGAEDCSELLWARGFLLTAEAHRPPLPHWRRERLGGRWLSWDPRTPLAVARAGSAWAAVLGRAIDLDGFSGDTAAIAATLLRARAGGGREALLERLDALSGRYAVFDGDEHSAFVQTDAAGMRAVFYRDGAPEPAVASHAGLVAEHTGAGPSAFPDPELLRAAEGAYALPGRATTFADVVMLTPNTELDLVGGRVRRCFPRRARERRTAGEVVDAVLPLLQGQLAALTETERLEVSLTAGLDSRTTLALTRPFTEKLSYFTYDTVGSGGPTRRGVQHDVAVAAELAGRLGLEHHRIEVERRTPAEPLRSVMERNSPRRSHPGLSEAHRAHTPERGLHLRSNLYEIGRAYYRSKREQPRTLKPAHMVGLLTKGRSQSPELRAAFAEYVDATGFDRAQRLYDPSDLFYWEHRSGMWLNAHLSESDIAFDTFILVNSRLVYRLLLSAPLKDRIAGTVFLELIRRSWPEVLEVPVNGETLR
ncbi:hypothetical protein [Glycomyces tenuis]|uniref:hypothetical protein n=1 Tax=Glycomyces tenuis TaxID=58116 RepID=UPI0012DE885B|nr:hypothetical protein [Glycomyces tenuis]